MGKNSTLIFISGSSGVGKNTIINALVSKQPELCQFLISNTTRPRRDVDRKEGQYHYITKEEFQQKIDDGEMLEYDIYNGNYYGVGSAEVIDNSKTGKVLLKDLTVRGVLKSREVLQNKISQIAVFLTESKKELKRRLQGRGERQIKSRLKVYGEEQKMQRHYDYVIRNTNVNKSIEKVEAVINTEHFDSPILTNVSTQRVSARQIERISTKLNLNKKVKPIKVTCHNDNIYIVDGINTYLASVATGKKVIKKFVDKEVQINSDINQDEWIKIVKSYS